MLYHALCTDRQPFSHVQRMVATQHQMCIFMRSPGRTLFGKRIWHFRAQCIQIVETVSAVCNQRQFALFLGTTTSVYMEFSRDFRA